MHHTDIPTGLNPLSPWGDSTSGPASTFRIKNQIFVNQEKVCYVYSASTSCSMAEKEALADGTAIVKDFIVVGIGEGSKDEMMR